MSVQRTMEYNSDDALPSDGSDLEEVVRLSQEEYHLSMRKAGPSRIVGQGQPVKSHRDERIGRLADIEDQIKQIDEAIAGLAKSREDLLRKRHELQEDVETTSLDDTRRGTGTSSESQKVDYSRNFEWSPALEARMRDVFGIKNFRLCQKGVCNANMDNRDIICVMPTGGGKSLTYQLPALMSRGCTLVVSPLIALMTDQILHLHDAGVDAIMLTGSTSRTDARNIQDRMLAMASGQGGKGREIKLCYVTPEKLAKSKMLMSLLESVYKAGYLARIVLDEAHCVSQMGHDYRPDYTKLNILRKLFPKTPIMALSATCPPKVLDDLVNIMGMRQPVQNGASAGRVGTVYFSSPLYRKNLHYLVLAKPSGQADTIKAAREYILEHHRDHCGIIYCLSKKDAESVAAELQTESGGKIQTGVYHSDVSDVEKERLHKQWRNGQVKVVCATVAFGLGIDKGDVRFVLHHSLPKSIEGFYQESGRAGRDGKDADCVLFYRPQDATRLSQLTVGEIGAQAKLHQILEFVQDLEGCRKIQFAKYFSASSQLSVQSWTTQEEDVSERCGHCDNCKRAPESIKRMDVRLPAWQILKVSDTIKRSGGRQTIGQLANTARGLGNGEFAVSVRRRGGGNQDKGRLDLDEISGGKLELSREDAEILCIFLLIKGYMKEDYHQTSHRVNVYLVPGPKAPLLTMLSRDDIIHHRKGPQLQCCLVDRTKHKPLSKKPAKESRKSTVGSKGKEPSSSTIVDTADEFDDDKDEEQETVEQNIVLASRNKSAKGGNKDAPILLDAAEVEGSDADAGSDDNNWLYSMRLNRSLARKRSRIASESHERPRTRSKMMVEDDDVISIPSD